MFCLKNESESVNFTLGVHSVQPRAPSRRCLDSISKFCSHFSSQIFSNVKYLRAKINFTTHRTIMLYAVLRLRITPAGAVCTSDGFFSAQICFLNDLLKTFSILHPFFCTNACYTKKIQNPTSLGVSLYVRLYDIRI